MDQLVEGTISMKQAAREVRQKARRKAEQRMLKKNDEKKIVTFVKKILMLCIEFNTTHQINGFLYVSIVWKR